ncbi:hypothetical protein RIF29_15536 [Crotalaria pallida]|uniref:Uncharacterized protein n=1 Tax=Crotalaria pallida TaxID=3830 RepID=A0AAN9ICP2_CROPI
MQASKNRDLSAEFSGSADLGLEGNELSGPELPLFNFSCISKATNDFSEENKLGQGGFGPVYKGKLPSGEQVAVKRLSKRLVFSNIFYLVIKGKFLTIYTRQQKQNRGRMNGYTISQGNAHSSQLVLPSRESSTQQLTGQAKYVPSGHQREMEKGPEFSSSASNSEMLHSMLSAAPPKQRLQ